ADGHHLGGELILTSATDRCVGFGTGDLVRLERGACGCGRADVRALGGILGRLTDATFVHGIQLLPCAVEDVVRRHPAVADYHLVVYSARGGCVRIEVDAAI